MLNPTPVLPPRPEIRDDGDGAAAVSEGAPRKTASPTAVLPRAANAEAGRFGRILMDTQRRDDADSDSALDRRQFVLLPPGSRFGPRNRPGERAPAQIVSGRTPSTSESEHVVFFHRLDDRPVHTFGVKPASAFVLFLVALSTLGLGCHDEHGDPLCDDDGQCDCSGLESCEVECEGPSCSIDCNALNDCDAACEDDCAIDCDDLDNCDAACGNDCSIDCTSLSQCDAACGEACDYSCRNASTCNVTVGPSSSVDCQSVGQCAVDCEGACEVDCSNAGSCDVRCVHSDGSLGDPEVFDTTRFVCS